MLALAVPSGVVAIREADGGAPHHVGPSAPRRRRRLQLASLGAMVLSGPAGAQINRGLLDGFRRSDGDGDGELSEEEYLRKVAPEGAKEWYKSIFSQADIDDNGRLSLNEYTFAKYLSDQGRLQDEMDTLGSALPQSFVDEIDRMFQALRSTPPMYGVRKQEILAAARLLLTRADAVNKESLFVVSYLFDMADVVRDGKLNLNELDFLHFILREFLVRQVVTAPGPDGNISDRGREILWDSVFTEMDQNRDGYLEEHEVLHGVSALVPSQSIDRAFYEQQVARHFRRMDLDQNGKLSKGEAVALFDLLNEG